MPKLKLVINEGDSAETIKQRLTKLFEDNKETLAPYHALDYVEGLENLEADGQCMFSEEELHDLVYTLGKIVSATRETYRLHLVLYKATIKAEEEEEREVVDQIELLVNEDLEVAKHTMYRIDQLITHAAFISEATQQ